MWSSSFMCRSQEIIIVFGEFEKNRIGLKGLNWRQLVNMNVRYCYIEKESIV